MLTSEKLILVELHKAGSARLKKLLGDVLGGESSGKGKNYADELAGMGKPIVGFVCNPLTWYLALWRQGCEGKGDLHKRLTDDARWVQLIARRQTRAVKEGAKPDAKAIPEGWGAERAKTFWYGDPENAEAFREWLKAVLGVPGLRKLLDHGYGGSPMNRMAGLMTYDFFIMFVRNAENMEKSVDSLEALQAYHRAGKVTDHFIRSEAISADLLRTLQAVGVTLTAEQRAAVEGLKDRSSADNAAIVHFYDTPSLRLVAKREAFVNQLFDYGPPSPEARAKARKAAGEAGEGKANKAGKGKGGAKLSLAEKAERKAARMERQIAKSAKGEKTAKPDAAQPAPAKAPEAPAKPQKVKKVKNKPLDEDVIEAEE